MRLLYDETLSPQLVRRLGDVYPGSAHVRDVGLLHAGDDAIWRFAAGGGYAVVTKDVDFYHRSTAEGHPPKVVWIISGNGPVRRVADLLRRQSIALYAFASGNRRSLIVLGDDSQLVGLDP